MQVYLYDEDTGEYLHPLSCQPNPKHPGEFLIPPGNTLAIKPPEATENQKAVVNQSKTDWQLLPDFRGTEYWLPDGSQHEITELGVDLPEDALDEPPPPSAEELEQQAYLQWKAERQAAVDAITVTVDNMVFDGDETSQGRMLRAITVAVSEDEQTQWILADNTVAMVSAAQLKVALRIAGSHPKTLKALCSSA